MSSLLLIWLVMAAALAVGVVSAFAWRSASLRERRLLQTGRFTAPALNRRTLDIDLEPAAGTAAPEPAIVAERSSRFRTYKPDRRRGERRVLGERRARNPAISA